MAFDPKGRIIVSDQDSEGVFRVTLAKDGEYSSMLSEPESRIATVFRYCNGLMVLAHSRFGSSHMAWQYD
jgi:hypothetical protein